jgi:NhaA family Na+:H+ antiporter
MAGSSPPVGHVPASEERRLASLLRQETTGGFLLIAAAIAALIAANSPLAEYYTALRDLHVGPASLHLDLTLGEWASDGLLALFFFLVGLELKREVVAGRLREPRRAVVPIAAAVGGVVVPAVLYLAITAGDGGARAGWPIPTATDIAFALAILAVVGSWLPAAVRIFLLTLAVVDDLIAIALIAVLYTADLQPLPLVLALVPLAAFAFCVQFRPLVFEQRTAAVLLVLVPLAVMTWILVHASGIHATIAGVALGVTVPVLYSDRDRGSRHEHEPGGLAEHFEHELRPLSAGFAVPVFAFFAAGVPIGGLDGLREALGDPVAIGILVGLVVGKPIGILGVTWLATRITRAELDDELRWGDLAGMSIVAGIGFTVSLLLADLSFGTGSPEDQHAKLAVLVASVVATVAAAVVLGWRRRTTSASPAEA